MDDDGKGDLVRLIQYRDLHGQRRVGIVNGASIQVLDWNVKEPFDQLVKKKLSHAPAWLGAIGR